MSFSVEVESSMPLIQEKDYLAILMNDTSFDGKFLYAVRTTGIFCRPSCKSKPPKRSNVTLFATAQEALEENYRPCKRCKPTGSRLPDQEWIDQVTAYIDIHYNEPLTLDHLAEVSHGSPYHLHRTFSRIVGVTPMGYVQETRINHAKQLLEQTQQSVSSIGHLVGMNNTPYFITLFKQKTGLTPQFYRQTFDIQI
ncbi:AraC family transcriptional regulator of adaptative response / methylphosphotriester-DNA alkyltransferase methyltransferase [Paenibacillus shirakamiensis]|uniref:AraC family transcriptional regulator of adaptative response / methylphosphotriester-DNA alkyltransferase methyltransferase n=1 Tax=Paenibacillus shirakamiensis TaxID=1265935 RepID=A0ABS4JM25_9BACL|nr:bifunctional transcriptional activator/DNA repair enzyme AdaA [Paenibacillus shirakamiensis]MBP2002031.1 AraC family transcriptional regulator of adaptative response / methylphosphotriester-DNA alkyltransferase methyltransferase [Paenibacillus shirakamiensis]